MYDKLFIVNNLSKSGLKKKINLTSQFKIQINIKYGGRIGKKQRGSTFNQDETKRSDFSGRLYSNTASWPKGQAGEGPLVNPGGHVLCFGNSTVFYYYF